MDLDADSDESSSPETLDQFREKWQNELKTSKKNKLNQSSVSKDESIDEQADRLFTQAVELEKRGKVFEAMGMYRRAVHLDRDIEFKMYDKLKTSSTQPTKSDEMLARATHKNINLDGVAEDLQGVDLVARFQQSIANGNGQLFESNTEKGVISTESLHISYLPVEIILHILRWVVSSSLDLRSLEQCSMVCKGFYICARDDDIWRLACQKIWGQSSDATKFRSWRQMFIARPRVCFNGCYISKTSYLRYGERSFQDQSYRPVHLVKYYRYIRFFPDRSVIVATSADEPSIVVGKMQRNNFMEGNYKFNDDVVTIIVQKNSSKQQHQNDRIHGHVECDTKNPTFCLQLKMSYTKKRRTPQLEWNKYSIIKRKNKHEELCTDFELKPKLYPPLIFSRVKSYDAVAHRQL